MRLIVVVSLVTLLLGLALSPAALAERRQGRVVKFEGTVISGPADPAVDAPLLGDWEIKDEDEIKVVTVGERTNVVQVHGDLAPDAQVMVIAREGDEGALLALVIQVLPVRPRVVMIRGFVSELDEVDPPARPEYMVVLDRTILLDEEITVIRGNLKEGSLVHVVAKVDGDTITALKVNVLNIPMSRTLILRGHVQGVDGAPPTSIKLWGIRINVTEETEIEGDLAVEDYVKVKAKLGRDGITASEIRVIERDGEVGDPEGTLDSVSF
jgi:hypothetical protein